MANVSVQEQVDELFADARQMYEQAIELLEQDDTRDSAEKVRCATRRSTDGLVWSSPVLRR